MVCQPFDLIPIKARANEIDLSRALREGLLGRWVYGDVRSKTV